MASFPLDVFKMMVLNPLFSHVYGAKTGGPLTSICAQNLMVFGYNLPQEPNLFPYVSILKDPPFVLDVFFTSEP